MRSTVDPQAPSQQYWLDRKWIHDNYNQLVVQYANDWIAVRDGQVLASGPELAAVESEARAKCSAQDIVFQFIDDGSLIF